MHSFLQQQYAALHRCSAVHSSHKETLECQPHPMMVFTGTTIAVQQMPPAWEGCEGAEAAPVSRRATFPLSPYNKHFPTIHWRTMWRSSSPTLEQVHTLGSTNGHTCRAFMAIHPPHSLEWGQPANRCCMFGGEGGGRGKKLGRYNPNWEGSDVTEEGNAFLLSLKFLPMPHTPRG